jgi:hypothetical protein
MSTLSRSEQTLAARLRVDQHPKVGKMHWKYLNLCEGSACRCCGLVEETIGHIFDECKAQVVVSLKTAKIEEYYTRTLRKELNS